MPELDDIIEQLRRVSARRDDPPRDWYAFQAKADSRKAELRIYDEIGWWGTRAKTFGQELAGLDVDHIDLFLNSPGGEAHDGIAIYNALKRHKAKVRVVVDGLAASAASVIAMAGDEVVVNLGGQLMIHDAWGLGIGNAKELSTAAESLDKLSAGMADIYAARAGGTAEEWRAAMQAETWYTAAEAVDAGLADSTSDTEPAADAQARFDLKAYAFAYAGRAAAPAPAIAARRKPAPKTTAEPTAGDPPKNGGVLMDAVKIREALGLPADAPDGEVTTALAAAGYVQAAAPTTPPAPAPTAPAVQPEPPKAPAQPVAGTMTIDVTAWEEQQKRIQALEARAARAAREERDTVIDQAVKDGKFPPARKEHWARLWDADPEGTRTVLASLAKGVVPMSELGYGVDGDNADDLDAEFAHLFPKGV